MGATGRRFLVSVGVSTYQDSGITALPGATVDASRVADLLVPMGYERVLAGVSANPSRNKLVDELDEWVYEAELGPEDTVVLYFAGHGVKEGAEHYLLCSDHRPGRWSTAVRADELAKPMVRSTVGHLLVVLDTCFASAGTESVATLATQLTHTRRGSAQRAMIAAARGKETAKENKFVDALTLALTKPRTGPSPRYLSVREVTDHINELLDSARQEANHSVIDSSGRDPFFDNPLYIPTEDQNGLDLGALAKLRRRHEGHYGPRGKGLEHAGERGDYFTGRTSVLGSLADWLRWPHDRKARVVTGDPGSGKSAVLGRFLDLTDPRHPARSTHPDAPWLPEPGLEAVRLWARRSSSADLVRDLGAAVALPDAERDQLLRALGDRRDRIVIVIDSLDEAGTAGDQSEGRRIARELLQPLSAMPAVRLIVGTRRDLIPALGHAVEVLDLDADDHAREAVTDYARALLLDSHDPDSLSPYRHAPELANEVAAGIASQAGRSFLVARMNARALVHRQRVVDTGEEGWELSLPSDAKEAFADYLDRFGAQRQRAVRLLRPLAYAQRAGLPWSTIWAPLAEALSGTPCSNDDLEWLFEVAGSYITEEEGGGGGSVFRLYHETMAEYLRVPSSFVDHQRGIAVRLRELVSDWASAHPYVLEHLASHAVAGGVLAQLLADAEYVVHASPVTLLRALDASTGEYAERFAAVYRTSAHLLLAADIDARRDILSVDAARYGWSELAERISRGRTWRVAWATGGLVHPAHRRTLVHDLGVPHVLSFTVEGSDHALTSGGEFGTLRQWDLQTGECTRVFGVGESPAELFVKLVIDDRLHALVVAEGLHLWDLHTGERTHSIDGPSDVVQEVCGVTLGGRPHALTTTEDEIVQIWDLESGECRLILTELSQGVIGIDSITLHGRPHVLVHTLGSSVQLWDVENDRCVRTIAAAEGPVWAAYGAIIDNTPHVLIADGNTVRVWDLQTGVCAGTFGEDGGMVHALNTITINGRPHILSAGSDETIRLWDLRTGARVLVLPGHTNTIEAACAATVNGRPHALTASRDGSVRLWSLDGDYVTTTPRWHTDWVVEVAGTLLSNRPHAVTVSFDDSVRLWDVASRDRVRLLHRDTTVPRAVCTLEVDGRPHALTGEYEFLNLLDLQTGKCIRSFAIDSPHPVVQAVHGFTLDGHPHALSGDSEGALRLWNLRSGEQHVVSERSGHIRDVFSIDVGGQPLAVSGDSRGVVCLWDLRSRECLAILSEEGPAVQAVCGVTLDGRPHALIARRSIAQLWDLERRVPTLVLSGHTDAVIAVSALTLDSHPHALTASEDATARLWDLRTGACTEVISLPLPATAATPIGDDLLLCFTNDIALFHRTKNH
ncbi:caspase family protein [Streptomyces sp. NPDC005483]|uniref:caspase family protein n=1 Tax=Streptomyces sp. NPDC005483 TaxID=3154882 RepID=UPI00339E21B9